MNRILMIAKGPAARSLLVGSRAPQRALATKSPLNVIEQDLKGKPVQDVAPEGGFPEIDTSNQNVARGLPGWAIWLGSVLMIGTGYYLVGKGNRQRNAGKREKRAARLSIVPYLQAEEDIRYNNHLQAKLEDEAKIMKGVKGWKVGESVYNNKDYWIPPTPLMHPRLDAQAKF